MTGLFFCLASAEGAGLLFLPGGNTAPYKRLQRVLCSPCKVIITHAAKQRTGLYRGISVNLTHSSAHNTTTTQTTMHRLRHVGGHTVKRSTSIYPDATATPDAVQGRVAAYYNKVYKGAAYRKPCQPGGVSSYHVRIAGKC